MSRHWASLAGSLCVAVGAVLWSAGVSWAGHGGHGGGHVGGGHMGGGHIGGVHHGGHVGGIHHGGYYGGHYGGVHHGGLGYGGYGGYGRGFGFSPFIGGFGLGYGLGYGSSLYGYGLGRGYYGYGRGYYNYGPSYGTYSSGYYGTPGYYSGGAMTTYPSTAPYYSGASLTDTQAAPALSPNDALLNVHVPGDATVWINGDPTTQSGEYRQYVSTLDPGKNYNFKVRAQWTTNGQVVDQTRTVNVQSGEQRVVDFVNAKAPAADAPPQ